MDGGQSNNGTYVFNFLGKESEKVNESQSGSSVVRHVDRGILGPKAEGSVFIPTAYDRAGRACQWSTPESRAMSASSPCEVCSGYGSRHGIDCSWCRGFVHPSVRKLST